MLTMMDAWTAKRIIFIESSSHHNVEALERKQGLEVQVLKFLQGKCLHELDSGLSTYSYSFLLQRSVEGNQNCFLGYLTLNKTKLRIIYMILVV